MGATLAEISEVLKAKKSVVIITGAGLSAASGTRKLSSSESSQLS